MASSETLIPPEAPKTFVTVTSCISPPLKLSSLLLSSSSSSTERRKPNKDEDDDSFVIDITVEIVIHNLSKIEPPKNVWSRREAFNHSRRAFAEATESEQRKILSSLIEYPNIPIKLHEIRNLHWGYTRLFVPRTLEEISDRVLQVSHKYLAKGGDMMRILVRKEIDMGSKEYQGLSPIKRCDPLGNWILKRHGESEETRSIIATVLYKLYVLSPADNMYFGMKNTRIQQKEDGDKQRCAICLKSFRDGEVGIRMPCSHLFHGFCILKWFNKSPTCPYCRFEVCKL